MRARLLLILGSLLLSLAIAEVGARLLLMPLGVDRKRLERARDFVVNGDVPYFEPRAYTNFGLRRGKGNNLLGFRGWGEEISITRNPAVTRIACLGASTTQGGGPKTSYPAVLDRILEVEASHEVEVMNWGTSGWTTAETLVNYFLNVQDYAPDIVVLHHAVNDILPRLYPDYRSDFTHYRSHWRQRRFSWPVRWLTRVSDLAAYIMLRRTGELSIGDVVDHPLPPNWNLFDAELDPKTEIGFRRNLKTIADHVRLLGGQAVLTTMPFSRAHATPVQRNGISDHNRIIRELAAEDDFLLVDLDGEFGEELFVDVVHTTPDGDRLKARRIADVLLAKGLL